MDRGAWRVRLWGCKELDTTEHAHIPNTPNISGRKLNFCIHSDAYPAHLNRTEN